MVQKTYKLNAECVNCLMVQIITLPKGKAFHEYTSGKDGVNSYYDSDERIKNGLGFSVPVEIKINCAYCELPLLRRKGPVV